MYRQDAEESESTTFGTILEVDADTQHAYFDHGLVLSAFCRNGLQPCKECLDKVRLVVIGNGIDSADAALVGNGDVATRLHGNTVAPVHRPGCCNCVPHSVQTLWLQAVSALQA